MWSYLARVKKTVSQWFLLPTQLEQWNLHYLLHKEASFQIFSCGLVLSYLRSLLFLLVNTEGKAHQK